MVKSWRALKDVGTGVHKYKVYQIMTRDREEAEGVLVWVTTSNSIDREGLTEMSSGDTAS